MPRLKIAAGHNKAFGDCVVFPGYISGTVRRIDSDYQPVLQPRLYKRQREIVVVYKPAANNDTLGLYEETEKPYTIGFTYTIAGTTKNVVYEVVLKEVLIDTNAADEQTLTATFLMEDIKFSQLVVAKPHP